MSDRSVRKHPAGLSRRAFALGAAGAGAAVLAGRAGAAPSPPQFPMEVACARVGPTGLVHVSSAEQADWIAMQTRLGALVSRIEPLQPSDMFGVKAPELDGGASCAMLARQLAAEAGFGFVVLYATQDGKRPSKAYRNWASKAFSRVRAFATPGDDATGEAHVLDVGGGAPVVSAMADTPPRSMLNPFDRRDPEREALLLVIDGVERRLQGLARTAYDAGRSIAD